MSLNNARHVILSAGLPPVAPQTLRFQFANTSFDPVTDCYSKTGLVDTWSFTKVADGIYDFHVNLTNWKMDVLGTLGNVLNDVRTSVTSSPLISTSVVGDWVDIIDSNLTGVTDIYRIFVTIGTTARNVVLKNTNSLTSAEWCSATSTIRNLVSLTVGDLSSVDSAQYMLAGCSALTSFYCPSLSPTNSSGMFQACLALTSVTIGSLGQSTNGSGMFRNCTSLTTIPASLDTSSMTNVAYMFSGCTNVESGALALYTQMSTQTTPPSAHSGCFSNCGANTVTGAAELAQIPASWGGLGA